MMQAEISDDLTVGALVRCAARVGCKVTIKFELNGNGNGNGNGKEHDSSSLLSLSVALTPQEQLRKDVDTFRNWKKEKAGKLTCRCGKEYRSYNGLRLHSKKCAKGGVPTP
jgi:hypothetical protein